jgi:hypothetical protein
VHGEAAAGEVVTAREPIGTGCFIPDDVKRVMWDLSQQCAKATRRVHRMATAKRYADALDFLIDGFGLPPASETVTYGVKFETGEVVRRHDDR